MKTAMELLLVQEHDYAAEMQRHAGTMAIGITATNLFLLNRKSQWYNGDRLSKHVIFTRRDNQVRATWLKHIHDRKSSTKRQFG